MKNKLKPFTPIFAVLLLISFGLRSQVQTYPKPLNVVESEVFSLNIDGNPVAVMKYMDYHYAHFEFDGEIDLQVTASEVIADFTISPQSLKIPGTTNGNQLAFQLAQITSDHVTPNYLVLQINELEKLVILGDRPETDVPPSTGEGIYNILEEPYNADPTGETNTQAVIQQAIDDANRNGGGTVYVPNGLYRIKQNLALKSNVNLYLAPGAVLKAIENRDEYASVSGLPPAFIVHNAENAKIFGRGAIDGSGFAIMNPAPGFTTQSVAHPRRRVIELDRSENIRIEGIIVKDGSGWTVDLVRSDTVTVQNVKVLNHKDIIYKIQNDGINSTSSSNTLINQCFIITIDDAMCAKARYGNMENCTFSNNVNFTWAAGVKAGMQSVGDMKNIVFRNCDIIHGRRGVGIDTREGFKPITGVVFNDIRVEELNPTSGGGDYCVEFIATYAPISDITVRRVSCPTNNKVILSGSYDITNILFEGLEVNGQIVIDESMIQLTKGFGIDVSYTFDTIFSDNIITDTTFFNALQGWNNTDNFHNNNIYDIVTTDATDASVEYEFDEPLDIYKARVYSDTNTETTWMLQYQDESATEWTDAFDVAGTLKQGWNNKTFYAKAKRAQFRFTNTSGNIIVNEIQAFANVDFEDKNNGSDTTSQCLLIEPEDLVNHPLFAPFYVADDPAACGGSYIVTDQSGGMDTPSEQGRVVVLFDVEEPAEYHVSLRVIAPSIRDDSFWIVMNGTAVRYNQIELSDDWIWVEVPKTFNLEAGTNKLEIVRRENNTKLDQILVTTSADLPIGCAPCVNIYEADLALYYLLESNASAGGSISMDPEGKYFAEGSTVVLSAIPEEGYVFDKWTGSIADTTNPIVITMDGNKTVNASFSLDTGTNVNNPANNPKLFFIFPNPASDYLTLSINVDKPVAFKMYNIQGQMVYSADVTKDFTLDLNQAGIGKGFYLYSIETENQSVAGKIIVIK
jgi:uncharacterized repeat protein (TIGR02543 family)